MIGWHVLEGAAQLEGDPVVLLVVSGRLVLVAGIRELLLLEVVRVGHRRPDRLGGPLGVADRRVDVRRRDVGVHDAWRLGGIGVEVGGADPWSRLRWAHDHVGSMVADGDDQRPCRGRITAEQRLPRHCRFGGMTRADGDREKGQEGYRTDESAESAVRWCQNTARSSVNASAISKCQGLHTAVALPVYDAFPVLERGFPEPREAVLRQNLVRRTSG